MTDIKFNDTIYHHAIDDIKNVNKSMLEFHRRQYKFKPHSIYKGMLIMKKTNATQYRILRSDGMHDNGGYALSSGFYNANHKTIKDCHARIDDYYNGRIEKCQNEIEQILAIHTPAVQEVGEVKFPTLNSDDIAKLADQLKVEPLSKGVAKRLGRGR